MIPHMDPVINGIWDINQLRLSTTLVPCYQAEIMVHLFYTNVSFYPIIFAFVGRLARNVLVPQGYANHAQAEISPIQ